jgi:hypothetical protein
MATFQDFTTNIICLISPNSNLYVHSFAVCRSQSPRGLRHKASSPAGTLGSWARIPLEAWISMGVYSVFVLSCVQVAALRRADPPSKESYRLCKKQETEKAAKTQQNGRAIA